MYFEHDEMTREEGEVQKDRENDETHEKRRLEREEREEEEGAACTQRPWCRFV